MTRQAPQPKKEARSGARRALVGILLVLCFSATAVLPAFEPQPAEERLPPVEGWNFFTFPKREVDPAIYVVNTTGLQRSDKFSLVSLQGIVNRDRASIYLNTDDPEKPQTAWLRANLGARNYTYSNLTDLMFLYRDRLNGIVIYAEEFPDTINLATTLSGLNDCLICNRSRAVELGARYDLAVNFDLSQGRWAGNPPSGNFYIDAFTLYYPMCNQKTLATINPFLWSSRDWAISRRLFCFFLNPGPMTEPGQPEAFEAIMERTPEATTLVGWMRSDLGIEENYGMQVISKHGKVLFPCEDSPNLSILGALTASSPLPSMQKRSAGPPVLEDRTYLCFLMSDGDNTDYVTHFMRERWAAPERGALPVGWGLPPALSEAAPTMLEYYYTTATANDSFVAGSSGAAILYPDFYPASRLPVFLNRSRALMDKAGLESVWLINSYAAHEVQYSDRALSDYVDYLQPTGIFLDYGDVPVARPYWIQNGKVNSGVPVARSVHLWGSRENAVAKILLDAGAKPAGPYFIFVTVHTWTMGLSDVVEVVEQLRASPLGGTFEVIAPAEFLKLVQADMVRRADIALARARDDPLARALAGQDLQILERRMGESREAYESGQCTMAAGIASDVHSRTERLLSQRDTGLFALASVIIVAVLAVLVYSFWRRQGERFRRPEAGLSTYGLLLAATFLFFQSQYQVLFAYFWDWAVFLAVIPAALAAIPYSDMLARSRYSGRARLLLAAGNIALGSILQTGTGWAAALVAFGYVALLKELAPRLRGSLERALALAGAFTLGCALLNAATPRPFVVGIGLLWLGLFTLWALALPPNIPPEPPLRKPSRVFRERLGDSYPVYLPAAFLALTAVSLYLTKKHYLMLTYASASSFLLNLGVMVPVGSLAIAAMLSVLTGKASLRAFQPALLMMAGAGWLAVAFFRNPMVSSLLILFSETAMVLLAIVSMRAFLAGRIGGQRFQSVGRNLVLLYILANFLLVLPVLVYNLYFGKLPLTLNYIMYNFPLEFAIFLFLGALPFTVAAYYFHARDRPEEN
jgi:hypothetical protein